jgi:NitT/TauT family transport system substrate-binding protein
MVVSQATAGRAEERMRTVVTSMLVVLVAWLAIGCGAASRSEAPASAPAAAAPTAGAVAAPAGGAAAGGGGAPRATGQSASSGGAVVAQPLNPPQKVRVDSIAIAAEAPIYLAIEQGYFRELGLDVELTRLQGSADTVAMLSSDQLDVGGIAINPGAFNVIARGVDIRLVADRGSTIPGRSTPSLAIRTDVLERKPWTGYQDLRGMKLAQQTVNSIGDYWLSLMLQRGGLQLDDLEVIQPITYPDIAISFANKAIDAAMFNEPWATQQEQQGIIKKVLYADDVDPNGHVAVVVFSEPFARNTQAARNYMIGWLRGVRDYWDAYDGRIDFQRVLDVIQKYTALKDGALIRKIPPTGQNPAGYLNPATLAKYQDWFAERGWVTQKADIEKAYDPSFAEYANSVLGPYQPVENPRRPE